MLNFKITEVKETVSTNTDLLKIAMNKDIREGHIITALTQSGGRGRGGKPWVSQNGNLFLSVLLKPDCSPGRAAQLSFLVAICLRFAIAELLNTRDIDHSKYSITFKWPNDVLINNRKVSGILLEAVTTNNIVKALVCGVGVNLTSHPDATAFASTSILAETGIQLSRTDVMQAFTGKLDIFYEAWKINGFQQVRREWVTHAKGICEKITVKTPKGDSVGIMEGLSEEGELILKLENDTRSYISAGDVFF